MRSDHRLRTYWLLESFWIVVVILLFRSIEDRRTAALIASAGFVLIPSALVFTEMVWGQKNRPFFLVGQLQFLLLFAIPIVVLNFFPFLLGGMDLGISGTDLHRYSNISYFIMIVLTMIEGRRAEKQLDQAP